MTENIDTVDMLQTPEGSAMPIAMTPAEAALFQKFIRNCKSYFEFGTGGSTVFASPLVNGPIYSIDSSKEWLDKVASNIEEKNFERRLIFVDIGPIGRWGYPEKPYDTSKFLNYHHFIWDQIDREFELYLVDGRFRVACFTQTIKRLPQNAVIGMHDYRKRPKYHLVENFAEPIAEAENLTFFKKRPNIDSGALEAVIEAHRFDPY